MSSTRTLSYYRTDALEALLKAYLEGAEADLLRRGRILLGKIPTNPPREFQLLNQRCRDRLTSLLNELQSLASYDTEIRLRRFKRVVAAVDILEQNAIAALNRATDDDKFLNVLIDKITREIRYPLLPPVVTSLSQGYFYIYSQFGLLGVPLGEADALLHLPDLYHELAHPLIEERHDPRVQPFRGGLSKALAEVKAYISSEQERELRSRGPQSYGQFLNVWWKSWNESWLVEFFCDLFATYTLGPAFVWSHLHLCAKRGEDVFDVPRYSYSSHPADDARLRVMLFGLQIAGFSAETPRIEVNWKSFVDTADYVATPEYRRCYSNDLLKRIAEIAFDSVRQMGCRLATPSTADRIHLLFNTAWDEFWRAPKEYAKWEEKAVFQLRKELITT